MIRSAGGFPGSSSPSPRPTLITISSLDDIGSASPENRTPIFDFTPSNLLTETNTPADIGSAFYQHVSSSPDRSSSVFILSGPAGIGKTQIAKEMEAVFKEAGRNVFFIVTQTLTSQPSVRSNSFITCLSEFMSAKSIGGSAISDPVLILDDVLPKVEGSLISDAFLDTFNWATKNNAHVFMTSNISPEKWASDYKNYTSAYTCTILHFNICGATCHRKGVVDEQAKLKMETPQFVRMLLTNQKEHPRAAVIMMNHVTYLMNIGGINKLIINRQHKNFYFRESSDPEGRKVPFSCYLSMRLNLSMYPPNEIIAAGALHLNFTPKEREGYEITHMPAHGSTFLDGFSTALRTVWDHNLMLFVIVPDTIQTQAAGIDLLTSDATLISIIGLRNRMEHMALFLPEGSKINPQT